MQGAEQDRKYVALAEVLSWIAFRTFLDTAGIKERLRSDPACQATLEEAARQFSFAAGDGRLKARGRYLTDADDGYQPMAAHTDDIHENRFKDFQQLNLDRDRLQHLPAKGSRVIVTWRVDTDESYARAFRSYAGVLSDEGASFSDGYTSVEVVRDDLLREFPDRNNGRVRASTEETIVWCRQTIESGITNMNKAWEEFRNAPQFAGLSRDDALRPAWRAAKTKS